MSVNNKQINKKKQIYVYAERRCMMDQTQTPVYILKKRLSLIDYYLLLLFSYLTLLFLLLLFQTKYYCILSICT